MSVLPVVDTEKCNESSACAEVCPTNVIDIVGEKAVITRHDDCIECSACGVACPHNAISFP